MNRLFFLLILCLLSFPCYSDTYALPASSISYSYSSSPSYTSSYCGATRLFDAGFGTICKWTYIGNASSVSATIDLSFSPAMIAHVDLFLNQNFRNISVRSGGKIIGNVLGVTDGNQSYSIQFPIDGESISSISITGQSYFPDVLEIPSIQIFKHDSCPCTSGSVAQASCQNFLRQKIREVTIEQCKEWSTANPQTYHCDLVSGSPSYIAKKGDGLLNGSYPYDKFCTCDSGITSYSPPTLSEPLPSSCSSTTTSDGGTTTSGGGTTTSGGGTTTSGGNTTTSGGGTTTSGGSTTLSLDETNQLLQQILENLAGGSTSGGSSGNGSSNSNQLTSDYCEANKQSWSFDKAQIEYSNDCSKILERCERDVTSSDRNWGMCRTGDTCACYVQRDPSQSSLKQDVVTQGMLERVVFSRNGVNGSIWQVYGTCPQTRTTQVYCSAGGQNVKKEQDIGASNETFCLSIPPVYPAGCQQSGQPISPDDVDDSDGCIAKGGKWVGVVDGVGSCSFGGTQDEDGNVTGGYVIGTGNGGSADFANPGLGTAINLGFGTLNETLKSTNGAIETTYKEIGKNGEIIRELKGEVITSNSKLGELALKSETMIAKQIETNTLMAAVKTSLGAIVDYIVNIQCVDMATNLLYPCNVFDKQVFGAIGLTNQALGSLIELNGAQLREAQLLRTDIDTKIATKLSSMSTDIAASKATLGNIYIEAQAQNIELGAINTQLTAVNTQLGVMHGELQTMCTAPSPQNAKGCKIYAQELTDMVKYFKDIYDVLVKKRVDCKLIVGCASVGDFEAFLLAQQVDSTASYTKNASVYGIAVAALTASVAMSPDASADTVLGGATIPFTAWHDLLFRISPLNVLPSSSDCSFKDFRMFDKYTFNFGDFVCPAAQYCRLILAWVFAFATIWKIWRIMAEGIVIQSPPSFNQSQSSPWGF